MNIDERRLREEWKKLKAEKGHGVYARLSRYFLPFLRGPSYVAIEAGNLPGCINSIEEINPGYHLCPSNCHITHYKKVPFFQYVAVYKRDKVRVVEMTKDGLLVQTLASPSPA